ncbi:MAG TPA: AMP-binding protein, partial [Sphingomicrobium sp.]|nr:AMP-binding protein [Sphingomicrobium sp.]
ERAQISHAIVDSRFIGDFRQAAEQTHSIQHVIKYDGDYGRGELETRTASLQPLPQMDTGRDDPALIAFTSGTTGVPKGCVHFHRDILAPCDTFAKHLVGPKPGDIFMTSAPMAFTFGLGITPIFPLRFGAASATLEQASPPALLDAIVKHGVTHLGTAPTAYKAMLSQPKLDDALKTLRYCISAGEHLPEAIWRAWQERTGIAITDGIGATEMMHIFVSAAGEDVRPGATGKAVPGYIATVLDDFDEPKNEGVGRLAIKGPTGCRYLDDPRQRDFVVNGWNITGDTYRRDADGYYWYLARSDDMIVSSGYNIGAPEVENALLSHAAVAECAVIGVPCPERGQKVKAFVVLAADATSSDALAAELQAHAKAQIAPYKYPREIEFVEALPKTATGKLRRGELRK